MRVLCGIRTLHWGCFIIGKLDHQINEEIRDKELRVIGSQWRPTWYHVVRRRAALAEEKELDLVKIAPNAVPPVCKIMDYGKFRFEQLKKEKEAKKNQRVVEVKEIRMSPSIDTNDLNTKVKNAMKFLERWQPSQSHRPLPRPRNGAHVAWRGAAQAVRRELRRGRNGRKRSKARGTQYVHVPESQKLKINVSKNRKENYYAQAEIP